jgi:hypothetical protein
MALVVLAIHLRFSVPALMAGPWWSASADGASRGSLLGLLLWCVPIGRLVLSCFPPGEPGSHAPRNLAATLATSAVLGEIVLHLQGNLIGLIRWDAQPESLTVWVLLFGPWLVLAAVRLVTLRARWCRAMHRSSRSARRGCAGSRCCPGSCASCSSSAIRRAGCVGVARVPRAPRSRPARRAASAVRTRVAPARRGADRRALRRRGRGAQRGRAPRHRRRVPRAVDAAR